jgi:RimJ/RimL family protein N-acetyltransferase
MRLLTSNDPPAHVDAGHELVGNDVRLVPLTVEHAAQTDGWLERDPEGFAINLSSPLDFGSSFERFFGWLVERAGSDLVPFAVERAAAPHDLLGYTRFLHVEPARRMLHVGGTYYAPPARGTRVNPESKLLLLGLAFEEWGYNRVQIQTDVRNERSRRAIARIGATFEGVSRADYLRRDGTVRDTWVASVTRDEWPRVREHLQRLAQAAPQLPAT